MTTLTLKQEQAFVTIDCERCGCVFAVTAPFAQGRQKDGALFYCPSGHGLSYGDGTYGRLKAEAEKLKRELASVHDRLTTEQGSRREVQADLDRTAHSRRALRGQITKMKKRVAAGVCPCCNRHFVNLQRHMETQHKDFLTEEASP